jgi:primosomal protein N' (replication factor Y)
MPNTNHHIPDRNSSRPDGEDNCRSLETVEVAVALPVFGTYTYRVPDPLRRFAAAGCRVLVPFGRRRVTGFILGSGQTTDGREIKPILDVLDELPLFPESMIAFFRWTADYYVHPLGEVIKCALPGGLNRRDRTVAALTEDGRRALSGTAATGREKAILRLLSEKDRSLRELTAAPLKPEITAAACRALADCGWLILKTELSGGRIGPKRERYVSAVSGVSRAELTRQRAKIMGVLDTAGEIPLKQLTVAVPTTLATVGALERSGHLVRTYKTVYRDPFGEAVTPDTAPILNAEQDAAVNRILQALGGGFATYLLAGVTGSGKTEVYMRLAAEVIRRGLAVLILIPEIALITQMERRFRARFGEQVAVLHSGLNAGERYDQWIRILRGEVAIAIGARSAIFAPFANLGLLVVDEEHDASYKQEGSLRYNARDLSVVRAKLANTVALLGSATPSMESCHNAVTHKFQEVTLDRRVERRPLPEITVIDLRLSRDQRGVHRYITPQLREAMEMTLQHGEQVLLFLNRRGFATFPVCAACGEAVRCKHCDITLTFHQQRNLYRCHYCGFSLAAADGCDRCGSLKIKHLGMGTEKVEAGVGKLFPQARVARMDRDTTARRGALVQLLKDLRRHRIDILVGTQMVAKGHDFPGITLVGIICADLSLSFPDFRAGERTFQLLAQVSGRAGRGERPGRVILQTYNPDHFSILAAREQDFRTFYAKEIPHRRALNYPPFARMIHIKIAGKDRDLTATHARFIGDTCRQLCRQHFRQPPAVDVMGPIEAALPRVAGRYRWQILLKGSDSARLHRLAEMLVLGQPAVFGKREVHVALDVDPFSML